MILQKASQHNNIAMEDIYIFINNVHLRV